MTKLLDAIKNFLIKVFAEAPTNPPPSAPVKETPPAVKPAPITNVSREAYLRYYLTELWLDDKGQTETHGSNRSPMIDDVNRKIGADLGSPYCISGLLIRGVKVMCQSLGLVNPIPMTASTQSFFKSCRERAPKFVKVKGQGLPNQGDICIMQNYKDAARGHAYGLSEPQLKDIQLTIEYNTDLKGDRNGDGVFSLLRTQEGDGSKKYLGSVDVVSWILEYNPNFKVPSDVKLKLT